MARRRDDDLFKRIRESVTSKLQQARSRISQNLNDDKGYFQGGKFTPSYLTERRQVTGPDYKPALRKVDRFTDLPVVKPLVRSGKSFLSAADQELRNPSTNILGFAKNVVPPATDLGLQAFGLTRAKLPFYAASGLIGGAASKMGGESFGKGFEQGINITPKLAGITGLTTPAIFGTSSRLASRFNNPLTQNIVGRGTVGALNIPEGIEIRKSLGTGQYTPGDAALDFAIGAAVGRPTGVAQLRVKGLKPHVEDVNALDRATDILRNKKASPEQKAIAKDYIFKLGERYLDKDKRPEGGSVNLMIRRLQKVFQNENVPYREVPGMGIVGKGQVGGKKNVANAGSLDTLPKDIPVWQEAKAVGAKRIAPDRVPHQQLIPEEGIRALVNKQKKEIELSSNNWRNAAIAVNKLMNKYGDSLPARTKQNISKYPDLVNDYYNYTRLKKYAPTNTRKLSDIANWFNKRADDFKWTPEREVRALKRAQNDYVTFVKRDISRGYKYPDEVLNYNPSFRKATDSRARYEKGLYTSFSAEDHRIVFDDKNRIAAGMKRQDGTELLPHQKEEIVRGVQQTQEALGINLDQVAKDKRWVFAHLNGKNPFLTQYASGLYRRGDDFSSISVGGTESFRTLENGELVTKRVNTTVAHELGHALNQSEGGLFRPVDLAVLRNKYNSVEGGHRGKKYWSSDSEITARVIEQYVAVKNGHLGIFNEMGMWNKELYESTIKPMVESAMTNKLAKYKSVAQQPIPLKISGADEITDPFIKELEELQKPLLEQKNQARLKPQKQILSPLDQIQMKQQGISPKQTQLPRKSGKIPTTQARQQQAQTSQSGSGDAFIEDIIRSSSTDVKKKINILDYVRTPEFVLEKIGLADQAKALNKADDMYSANLKTEINKVSEWAKQAPSKESSQKIFRWLDGDKAVQLDQTEKRLAKEIQSYLSEWADKLNLPQDKRIAHYITHIFDKDFIQKEFDPDLAKIIDQKVSGSVYDPFLQKRLGKAGYREDVWSALDAYVKRATRKEAFDPVLEDIAKKADTLDLETYKYLQKQIAGINMQPTEIENLTDNLVKSIFGYWFGQRPTVRATTKLRTAVFRGALGLNVGSAIRNLSQWGNTYAKLGEKHTVLGYGKLFFRMARNDLDELYKHNVLADNIVQDRTLHATKRALMKVDKGLFAFFDMAEKINRGAAYFGAKSKGVAKGMDEQQAIEFAKRIVRETQFDYSRVGTPVALRGTLAKTAAQFMTYPIKQAEFLGRMAKNKEWMGLLRYLGASALTIGTFGKLIGMRPSEFIPFSQLITGEGRFETPVFQLLRGTAQSLSLDPDQREQARNDLYKNLALTFPAGVQIKKSIEGLQATGRGYGQSPSGRIRYPLPQDTASRIRGGLFGQYPFDDARQYFKGVDKGELQPLGEKQSEVFKRLPDEGSRREYYDSIQNKRRLKRKTDEAKEEATGIVEQGIFGDMFDFLRPKEVETPGITGLGALFELDALGDPPTDSPTKLAKWEKEAYKKARAILNNDEYNLTSEEKTQLIQEIGLDPVDVEYYDLASEDSNIRSIFVQEEVSRIAGASNNRQDMLEELVKMRREVQGKMILTSSVINDLVDAGTISKEEGKMLKKVEFGKDNAPKVKVSGRGGSAKLKNIKFVPLDIPMGDTSSIPEASRFRLRGVSPSLIDNVSIPATPRLRARQVQQPNFQVKFNL